MKPKRRIQLTLYSLFSILTFHKYYVCDDCRRIHRRTGNELAVCGGWYGPHVFVGAECADAAVGRACAALREAMFHG